MKVKKGFLREWLPYIGIILVILIIRQFLFTPVKVDGDSMLPNLKDRERLIVTGIGKIERFDTVIFKVSEKEKYVKRVVGLPGETVFYKEDTLYINGKKVREPFLDKEKEKAKIEGKTYTPDFSYGNEGNLAIIPDNHYFVMGDNRRNSTDSRMIGLVEKNLQFKKVVLRYWPMERFGRIE